MKAKMTQAGSIQTTYVNRDGRNYTDGMSEEDLVGSCQGDMEIFGLSHEDAYMINQSIVY